MDTDLCQCAFGLTDPGTRWIDTEPGRVDLGTVRLRGWHVWPVSPPDGFEARDIYLVKVNADIHQEPGIPPPRWLEVGYTFITTAGEATVLDALPRTILELQPASSYRLDGGLAFVPDPDGAGAIHLPACGPTIDVHGIYSSQIRWRYSEGGVRLGSHVSWLVLAVPSGTPEVTVDVALRHDLDPDDALGMVPAADTGQFVLRLDHDTDAVATASSTPTVRLTGAKVPRVFICYAHDNVAHTETVRKFAEFLCACGIDTHIDRWDLEQRRNWSQWAIYNINASDFVLVIASPLCKAVGDGKVDNKANRGLQSELVMLADKQHTDRQVWTKKILPVVLAPTTPDDLPDFLTARTFDHYKISALTREGAEPLLRTITRQPKFTRPQVATELINFDQP